MNGIVFLFPGQGSQRPGMGRALHDAFPECRAVFDAADEALGIALSRTCFDGTEHELALTETTQPAVLTVAVAALRALEARGIHPAAAAGHSLGEYGAQVAAGGLEFPDAVRTVRLRGRFMQEAVPVGIGTMAAILGLSAAEVARICEAAAQGQVVSPANLNSPEQSVISGHADAVARAQALAKEAGAKRVIALPVSAPFHCALMEGAAQRLARVLAELRFAEPRFPVFANVDARPVRSSAEARETLVRQVVAPVRWQETIEALIGAGYTSFVEAGPGNVLAGLMRQIRRDVRVISVSEPVGVEAAVREFGVTA